MTTDRQANTPPHEGRLDSKAVGVSQVVIGIAIVVLTSLTAWLTVWVIGLALVVWGTLDLYHGRRSEPRHGAWWRRAPGVLAIAGGIAILVWPGVGSATLSLILAALFIVGGLIKLSTTVRERPPNWGWEVLSALVSFGLAAFILTIWPVENFLVLGILLGIEIIMNGISLTAAGIAAEGVTSKFGHPAGGKTRDSAT